MNTACGMERPLDRSFKAPPVASDKVRRRAQGGPFRLAKPAKCPWVLLQVLAAFLLTLSILHLPTLAATTDPVVPGDMVFIDNGQVRLGVKQTSGAGIAWFSLSGTNRNLINHWDRGRLIQQSYYGDTDGSLWNQQPWRWNPVQGGDWKGKPATVLDLQSTTNTLYARSWARHWAAGNELTNVVFEQWITLSGKTAHVHFKMTYSGDHAHEVHDHEIPAFFVAPDLNTLVLYAGDKPWTHDALHRYIPGWPNEGRAMTENWAAYVGTNGIGIGAYVPVATNLTCYRFGDGREDHGSCSYFAPLTRFAITPGKVFEYDLHLAIGTADEIRATFGKLRPAR